MGSATYRPVADVTVRYWASARAAAGRDFDEVRAGTLTEVLDAVRRVHQGNQRFLDVLSMCSVLIGDTPVTTSEPGTVDVPAGSSVELLPPFAGG